MTNPYPFDPKQFPAFPEDLQISNETGGRLTPAWYYFLLNIWNKLGGVGQIPGGNVNIPPAVAPLLQTLTTSPFIFTAPATGFFTCIGGQVSLTRLGTTFLIGGPSVQTLLIKGDMIQIDWQGPITPNPVVWWEGGLL